MKHKVKAHHWLLVGLVVAAWAIFTPSKLSQESVSRALSLPESWSQSLEVTPSPQIHSQQLEVRSGDTLETLLNPLGISKLQIYQLAREVPQMTKLLPGQTLDLIFDAQKNLSQILVQVGRDEQLLIESTSEGFRHQSRVIHRPSRLVFAKSTIQSSLYLDGLKAGLTDALIAQLTQIFSWTIDFSREVRKGDSFSLIYEQVWVDGNWEDTQRIYAADFWINKERYSAVRFEGENGVEYYDEHGNNLRKAFSKNPVKNVRITSGFSTGRMHPILHKIRKHLGIDYAAPKGTPVYATGDGRVSFKGWSTGYGNFLLLSHAGKYETAYGHLNTYAKGIKEGQKIRQGQLIGYVGMTGLATGPHLHYEFRVNGKHVDPLSVKLPSVGPVPDGEKEAFLNQSQAVLDTLRLFHDEVDAYIHMD